MKLMTTLALLGATLLPDMADAKSAADCAAIDALISANEEFVESILENDPKLQISTRKEMESGLSGLRKAVTAEARTASTAAIAQLDAALAAGNQQAAMLSAMQNYSVLVENFKTRLPTSTNVAMLDHAGFSLLALASKGSPDWANVKTVQTALDNDVKVIDQQLGKGPLVDLLNHTKDSIDAAIAGSDAEWLKASAAILLDSVDLVESVVKNTAAVACR
jgi:hypothetical protein